MPGAFDAHRPPSRELLDDCVHCGFCLPTCPTYQLWGEEMDSPRGRIYLMNLAEKGEIGLDGPFATHIDRCLGCMACVTACPSGVQYDRLLESTRPQLERGVERDKGDRLFRDAIFALFPYKRRLRAAAAAGRALPGAAQDPGDPGARRAAAGPARRDGVAAAAGLGARRLRPPPGAHPRRRDPPRPGGAAHRLRAGRVLPPRQRGHRAGARRRGLGRARAPRPAVLRRAGAALRPRGARAGPGPARDRRLQRARRRLRRHQRRGLRLVDEGVRPPARRRPRVGGAGDGVQRAGARRARGAGRGRAAGAPAPGARPRRLPRRLPPGARAEGAGPAPQGAALDPRRRAGRPARGRAVLRLRGDLQHGRARGGGRARRAQGREHRARPGPTSSSRPTPAACCRSASTSSMDVPLLHPVQLLDASIRGVPVPRT